MLTVSSLALVDACDRLGVDTESMLAAVGLQRETLRDPDARLTVADVSALWAKAYELSGDSLLSLHAAEACPLGAYKVIDYMASNARTVGEAFRYTTGYFKLINTEVNLPIDESGDPVSISLVDKSGSLGVARPYAEYCLAIFVLHTREATGVAMPLRQLQFAHPRPPDTSEHARIFGCDAEFDAASTRIVIDRSVWEQACSTAQPGVLAVLAEHADMLLEKLPKGPELVERVRKAIGDRLRAGDPSLETVARELAMSPRSLQRHLRDLGYSYVALVDELRQETAKLYLAQSDVAIAEVSYLLGFSDQSSFNRAFKRWSGSTPHKYRREGRLGRGPTAGGDAAGHL